MNHPAVRKYLFIVFVCLISSVCKATIAQSPPTVTLRTWYAASGGFKVDAELIDVREGKVQLKKADGSLLWVPLDKLSLADVKFINSEMTKARQAVEQPASSNANNTDKSATSEGTKPPTKQSPNKASDQSAQPNAEASDAPDEPDMLENEPDAEAEINSATRSSSGSSRSPFAGMRESSLVLGRLSANDLTFPRILSPWLAVRQHAPGGQQYVVANIRTGKMNNPFAVDGHASAIALSPDGATLSAFTYPPKLSLYSTVSGRKLRDIEVGQASIIQFMAFLSPTQLLCSGTFNAPATIYDVKSGKAVKTIPITGHSHNKLAISPDGKWLAVPDQGVVAVYDLKAGKLKNQLAIVPEKGSKNTSVSVDDVAFCNDGTEIAVLGSGTVSEFQVFSLRTGKPIIKHSLSDRLSPSLSIWHYAGPSIEAIPGNKGYILYGSAIVDREKGGPIWVDKPQAGTTASSFRVLIDDERQLMLTSDFNAVRFEVVKLPWSEISRSKDLVAQGGTVEDAGLPLVKNVSANSAKLVEASLNPQAFQGKRIDAPVTANPNAIAIDRSFGIVEQIRFASPSSGRCVSMPSSIGIWTGQDKKKHALLIDLKQGKVEKSVDVTFLAQAHDVSPAGNWLIGTTGKHNDRVDLFNLAEGEHELGFRPSDDTSIGSMLSSVRFLSENVFITVLRNEATAWEFPELKALYKFRITGTVSRFPNSPLFIHRNEQGWCVRNASDGSLQGTLENSNSPSVEHLKTIQIRADESAAAALMFTDREQKVVVWNLLTGKRIHEISLVNLIVSKPAVPLDGFGRITPADFARRYNTDASQTPQADSVIWIGDNQLLVRWARYDTERFTEPTKVSQTVYSIFSLDAKRMLWDYRIPVGGNVDGGPEGQLWFVESTAKSQALVGVRMPSNEALQKIANAPPPKPLIAKGDELMPDVQVTISGDKLADGVLRDQVVTALVKNLAANDNDVSERASVKLTVRVERISGDYSGRSNEGPKLLATARLTDISNKVLWQRERVIDAQKSDDPSKPVLAENVRRLQWENAIEWIRKTVDPKEIYESWYYRGIGESLLTSEGEKIVELKTQ